MLQASNKKHMLSNTAQLQRFRCVADGKQQPHLTEERFLSSCITRTKPDSKHSCLSISHTFKKKLPKPFL